MGRPTQLVAAWIALGLGCAGEAKPDPRDRQPMVRVPAGWFWSGCTRPGDEICRDMKPPRRMWLSTFEIDVYETTWSQYRQCAEAGACPPPLEHVERRERGGRRPALATWEAAFDYCHWRGKRLPTEAEWEKSARGTDDRVFPWGDEPVDCVRAHSYHCELVRRAEVGTHPTGASPYGVHDLIGNAPEWVADPWTLQLPSDDTADLEVINPKVFGQLAKRDSRDLYKHVCKDGSQPSHIAARSYWSTERYEDRDDPSRSFHIAGIRCARDLPGPPPPTLDAGAAPQHDGGGSQR